MNIAQEIRQIKTLMAQGAQLLMLRLRLLRLDLGAQVIDIIIVLAMLAVIAVSLLVGLISLLFGLQAVLPEAASLGCFSASVQCVCWRLCYWHGVFRRFYSVTCSKSAKRWAICRTI